MDASQGIEAQTLANVYMALDADLEVFPVLNKIDLPAADPERVRKEIEDVIGLDASDAIAASAKEGKGIKEVLEAVVNKAPPPKGNPDAPLKALLFDSWYDPFQGAVVLIRVFDGKIKKGQKIKFVAANKSYDVLQLGVFTPKIKFVDSLSIGEVGIVIAGIREVKDTKIGDTVTDAANPAKEPLPGFKVVKPMVFSGLYPVDADQYEDLRDAMEKLRLNDSSFTYEPEVSIALGFGFRCGFLGLLHMEIIQERLEREFNLNLITTAPTVVYRVTKIDGGVVSVDNPATLPPLQQIEKIEEPFILATLHLPTEYVGGIMGLCQEKRGYRER